MNHLCHNCGKSITDNELAAYNGRCEDCWAYATKGLASAARSYSGEIIGDAKEISNQGKEPQ